MNPFLQANWQPKPLFDINPQPQATTAQQPSKPRGRGGTLTSLISEGGALGGAAAGATIGSVVPVVGTAIGGILGAGLGAFGGRLVENKVRDDEFRVGDAAKEGALSAVLAGPLRLGKYGATAAKGLKGGASVGRALTTAADDAAKVSIRGSLGGKVANASNKMVAKQFRLNPAQQFNFKNKHGIDATKVIKEIGINSPDEITQKLPSLYEDFASISKSIPSFKTSQITGALRKTYQPLLDSVLPAQQQLGRQLKSVADNIAKKYKDEIPSDIVNALRQEADSAVRYTLRGTSDEGVSRKTASALRELMQNAADKAGLKSSQGLSFKDLGRRISQLEDLAEITGRQDYLGSGSLPFGMTTLLGGTAGSAAFGPAGLGTAAVVAAGNSNAGRRLMARGTDALARRLASGAVKSGGARGAVTGATRGVAAESLVDALTNAQSSNTNAMTTSATPNSNAPITANMSQLYQSAPQMSSPFAQASQPQSMYSLESALFDIQNDPANADYYMKLYEFANPQEEQAKPLSGEAAKRALTSQSGLRSLQTLEEILATDPGAFQRQALPNPLGITARLTGTTDIRAATDNVVDVIARLRSGAAITDAEAKRFARLLPQPGDSVESARRKLANVRAELESFMQPTSSSTLEDALMQYAGAF